MTDADITFDQGNDNLSTLAFDSGYAENLGDFKFDGFISNVSAYDWDEQMPFNNNGYFFNGNGYSTRNEKAKFRFMTNKFTLSGTGLVSIKMAGRPAQLQVLDPTKIGTGEDPILKTLDVQDFVDSGVSNIYLNGSNYNTLHRVYWDLSEYIDQDIVLAIADKDTDGNWGMLFFDDLITKYDELPSFTVDIFGQTYKNSDVTYYGAFTDLYVKSDDTKYNSTFNEAYTFLSEHYYKTASLKGDKKHNYFDSLTTTEAIDTVDAYNSLSTEAKAIVESSKDYYFDGTDDNWQQTSPKIVDVKNRIKAEVKVTYVYNNGSENKETTVEYNKSFTPDKTPTKDSTWNENYTFEGWYIDSELTEKYESTDTIKTDLTLYAKWSSTESENITNIKNSNTKASLSYKYEAVVEEDESKTYTISNVAMRFGGFIKKDYFDAVKDHITYYGVKLTTKLPDNYDSFKTALEKDATFEEGKVIGDDVEFNKEAPNLANVKDKANDDQEEYYLFNVYLKVDEDYYTKDVYGVAYLKFDDNKIIYLNERKASVASLAQEYLDNENVDKNDDVKATLTQLAKTK